VETTVAELLDKTKNTSQVDLTDEQLLSMAEVTRLTFSTKCQPYLTRMHPRDAASVVLRVCQNCYCSLDYQVEICNIICGDSDDDDGDAVSGGNSKSSTLLMSLDAIRELRTELKEVIRVRDSLPKDKMKVALDVICLQRDATRRQAQFASLCEDCFKHSMELYQITDLGNCLKWPTGTDEIASLCVALLHDGLPYHAGALVSNLALHLVRTCSHNVEGKFEIDCQNRVLVVACEYLRDQKAPVDPRIHLCKELYANYDKDVLTAHGIVFSPLDIKLYPTFFHWGPALKLEDLKAPEIGQVRELAAFVDRMLSHESVSPNQMVDVGKALVVYQKEAQVAGEYTTAWYTLFDCMVKNGMAGHMTDLRRKCMQKRCQPPLTKEDEEKLRAKLSGDALEQFDASSNFTEAGAATAELEKARSESIGTSYTGGVDIMFIDVDLVKEYSGLIKSSRYSELTNVNPVALAEAIRKTPGSSISSRHAVLQQVGNGLIQTGNPISAAMLAAEYRRMPDFLRKTASVNALNACFYPQTDGH